MVKKISTPVLIVVGIIVIGAYVVFSQTSCNEYVDVVTLNLKFLDIIDTGLEKKCKTDVEPKPVTEEDIAEIVELKNDYIQKANELDFLKAEINKLQSEKEALELIVEFDPAVVPILNSKESQLQEITALLEKSNFELLSSETKLSQVLADSVFEYVSDEQVREIKCEVNNAIVEIDQKIYSWTDKVYITIIDVCGNINPNTIDKIGSQVGKPIKITTESGNELDYMLEETGKDTGIFTGELILTGFSPHDATGDGESMDATGTVFGAGPMDGLLGVTNEDSLIVSYSFSDDLTVISSSLIKWNIGEAQFLKASYQVDETATIRVIDSDVNLSAEQIDKIKIKIISNTDPKGIEITLEETNESTGIFEGKFRFTTIHRNEPYLLKVSLGEIVTATYVDRTLPSPYHVDDTLLILGTSKINEKIIP